MTTNDIDAIRKEWATQCATCDYGLPYDCTCPKGDPRPVVSFLCEEIEQLRADLAEEQAEHQETGRRLQLAAGRVELLTARLTEHTQETHR